MAATVTLDNPRAFHREALILVGGGALSGLAVSGLHVIAGGTFAQLTALSFGALLGLAASLDDDGEGTPALRLALAIGAGAVMALLWPVHGLLAAGAGGLLLGCSFSLAEERTIAARSAIWATYGFCMAAAVFTTTVLGQAVDSALAHNLFESTTWGLFLAFAAGLKRVRARRDPVLAELKAAQADLRGEERRVLEQARSLYDRIGGELERLRGADVRERAEEIAHETVHALVALTRRSRDLRVAAERTGERSLDGRIREFETRIRQSVDPAVRRELDATRRELVEQVRVRRRLDVAAARLEARQQRCFTALERLHVALVQSGGATEPDAAVAESIENLERLAEEIHWRNLSVDDLAGDLGVGEPFAEEPAAKRTMTEPPSAEEGRLDTYGGAAEASEAGAMLHDAPAGADGSLGASASQANSPVANSPVANSPAASSPEAEEAQAHASHHSIHDPR